VANAAVANLPALQTRYGVEQQFLVNHLGHFALLSQTTDLLRDGSGRVVLVSSSEAFKRAPANGIMFDNLDGHEAYEPHLFYGQSKLANALYAKELSRRLRGRGIAVNSVDPGVTYGSGISRHLSRAQQFARAAARLFVKSIGQAAATQALLAASPRVLGVTGEHWSDCKRAPGSPFLEDSVLMARLWDVSAKIIAANPPVKSHSMQQAA
jgi:WW domain-containing oxidoreductase